jgi:hypothetical protein
MGKRVVCVFYKNLEESVQVDLEFDLENGEVFVDRSGD